MLVRLAAAFPHAQVFGPKCNQISRHVCSKLLMLTRLFVAACLWQACRVAAFTLSPIQIEQLRLAAKFAPLDTEFCGAISGFPGPAELNFASDPLLKFFTYDTKDDLTWVLREEVQQCLESVSNSAINGTEWVVQANLWEAAKGMFQKLGEAVGPSDWVQFPFRWVEFNPTPVEDTVLRTASYRTAPMSSYPDGAVMQQPCNSLTNYAYYEGSLVACSNELSDFGGAWPWRSEMIAAPALLAFASFSLHSNPTQTPFLTPFFDNFAIRVLLFMAFQGFVRSLAVNINEPTISAILGILPDEPYGDARVVVRQLHTIWAGPADQWATVQALDDTTPPFELSISVVVAIIFYILLTDTVGAVLASFFYPEVCVILVDAVVPDTDFRDLAMLFRSDISS